MNQGSACRVGARLGHRAPMRLCESNQLSSSRDLAAMASLTEVAVVNDWDNRQVNENCRKTLVVLAALLSELGACT